MSYMEMSRTQKTVYTRDELFLIRDRNVPLAASTTPPGSSGLYGDPVVPQLPVFSNVGAPTASSDAGSLRDAFFGGSHGGSQLFGSRRASGPSTSAQHAPESNSASPVAPTLWTYRTKGGNKKPSNPMSLQEIQQLVADELVQEDEIELKVAHSALGEPASEAVSPLASGSHMSPQAQNPESGSYMSLKDACVFLHTAPLGAASAVHESQPQISQQHSAALGDRWRPSVRPAGGSKGSKALQQGSHLSASSLPTRHHTLSREDMMSTDEAANNARKLVTPGGNNSTSGVGLMPIGEDDVGLGALPSAPLLYSAVAAAVAPSIRAPVGLDVDLSEPTHATTTSVPLSCVTDSPQRCAPPPILSVDDITPPLLDSAGGRAHRNHQALPAESGARSAAPSTISTSLRMSPASDDLQPVSAVHGTRGGKVASRSRGWGSAPQAPSQTSTDERRVTPPPTHSSTATVGAWGIISDPTSVATPPMKGSAPPSTLYPTLEDAMSDVGANGGTARHVTKKDTKMSTVVAASSAKALKGKN